MTSKQMPADLSARMSASIVLSRREMKSIRKSERGKAEKRPAESREQKAERQGGECTVTDWGRPYPMHAEATDCTAGWQATGNGKRTLRPADTSLGKPVGESVTHVGFNVNEFMAEAMQRGRRR